MRIYYPFILSLVILFKLVFSGILIFSGTIGLSPDEAQYWTWSQQLDWGYYSKPPGIAWEIWLGTYFFGDTEFGVRAVTLLIGAALPIIVYRMARFCSLAPAACFWAALCMALSPIGILSSILAITDGGMLLFWSASVAYLLKNLQHRETPNGSILGLLICCGALFKWPIYFLWLLVFLGCIAWREWRSWQLLSGFGISLLALLPSAYWNMAHGWPTFRHVLTTMSGGHSPIYEGSLLSGNMFEFLGAQFAMMSPILLLVLFFAFWRGIRNWKNVAPGIQFCIGSSLLILSAAIIVSSVLKMQGNWAIFAYPAAFVAVAWYGWEQVQRCRKWVVIGVSLSTILTAFVLYLPTLQSQEGAVFYSIPYRMNPFRHNLGWVQLAEELKKAGYDPERDFLFGDKYQTPSILSFYGEGQKRAYFLNLQGCRKNQFCFWPEMAQEQQGKRGFFVLVENAPHLKQAAHVSKTYMEKLKPYFAEVAFLGEKPLFKTDGNVAKVALLFECKGYNGKMPQNPELY